MQRAQEATGPSRPTHTITSSAPEEATTQAGTLRLRGQHSHSRRVAWTQNTIDNEKLGRKSSKICCIYHKPKNFDESSSESSSSSDSNDTGDEHDTAADRELKRKIQAKKQAKKSSNGDDSSESCCDHAHDHSHGNSSGDEKTAVRRNAYEKGHN